MAREFEELVDSFFKDADISKISTYIESLSKRLDAVEKKRLRKSGEPKLWPSLDCDLED